MTGLITRFTKATTRFGPCWVCWLATDNGPLAIWCSNAVLAAEFKRTKPKVGETIGVRFVGWSADKRYKKFKVVVADRPDETPDFDSWADAPEEPELPPYSREVMRTGRQPVASGAGPRGHDPGDPFT